MFDASEDRAVINAPEERETTNKRFSLRVCSVYGSWF